MSKRAKKVRYAVGALPALGLLAPQAIAAFPAAHAPGKTVRAEVFQQPGTAPATDVRPFTAHDCNQKVCLYVYGAGLYISSISATWQGQQDVCRSGHWSFRGVSTITSRCYLSTSYPPYHDQVEGRVSNSGDLCMTFNHVPGKPCVYVHRD
jgi:hypothetical protein